MGASSPPSRNPLGATMPTKTKKTLHAKPAKTPKAPKAPKLAQIDPKRDALLLMLPSSYAESPDMPVAIAIGKDLDADPATPPQDVARGSVSR